MGCCLDFGLLRRKRLMCLHLCCLWRFFSAMAISLHARGSLACVCLCICTMVFLAENGWTGCTVYGGIFRVSTHRCLTMVFSSDNVWILASFCLWLFFQNVDASFHGLNYFRAILSHHYLSPDQSATMSKSVFEFSTSPLNIASPIYARTMPSKHFPRIVFELI